MLVHRLWGGAGCAYTGRTLYTGGPTRAMGATFCYIAVIPVMSCSMRCEGDAGLCDGGAAISAGGCGLKPVLPAPHSPFFLKYWLCSISIVWGVCWRVQ